MLYAIHGGYVDGYDEGQERILHLVTKVSWVLEEGLSYAFTDRHAALTYASFFEEAKDLDKIDHDLMRSRYWHDTDEYPQRKERRQAEFLIRDFMPFDLIGAIGVVNDNVKTQVSEALNPLDEAPPVIVKQKWYY